MKQVFLSGQGQIEVFEVPVPSKVNNSVLVRNAFSLISTGTEGAAVTSSTGLMGLYEKVTSSKDKIDQVWSLTKKQGLSKTLEMVRGKLSGHTAIGYTCSGMIAELENEKLPFKVGQRVACMGAGFASHAEYVTVPPPSHVEVPMGSSHTKAFPISSHVQLIASSIQRSSS